MLSKRYHDYDGICNVDMSRLCVHINKLSLTIYFMLIYVRFLILLVKKKI